MRKINKRRILQLGMGGAIMTPLVLAISCNGETEKIDLKKDAANMFKQLSSTKILQDLTQSINSFFKNGWIVATNAGANPDLDLKSNETDAYVKSFFYQLIKNYIAPGMDDVIPHDFGEKISEEKGDKSKIDGLIDALKTWQNKQEVVNELQKKEYSDAIQKYLDLAGFNKIKEAIETTSIKQEIIIEVAKVMKLLKGLDFKKIHNQVVKDWVKQTINSQSQPTTAGNLLKTMFRRIGDRIGDKESAPAEVGFADLQKLQLARAFFYSLEVAIEQTPDKGLILELS